ncbi:hypothetical protein PR048_025208 [Dryococelus australis]|uniref:C2H2-type domain-containing protein n=1 Tax=Dryococelus australis TaxID=614101 RepID=A0ABQ9GQM9_9NEOP|nr:hypothetical protein PR048_025208 [Dryococelus australis]
MFFDSTACIWEGLGEFHYLIADSQDAWSFVKTCSLLAQRNTSVVDAARDACVCLSTPGQGRSHRADEHTEVKQLLVLQTPAARARKMGSPACNTPFPSASRNQRTGTPASKERPRCFASVHLATLRRDVSQSDAMRRDATLAADDELINFLGPRLFHLGEPGSIPGGVALVFSYVRIVLDDAACWRGFSRGSAVSPALSFRRCSILISLHPNRSQDIDYVTWYAGAEGDEDDGGDAIADAERAAEVGGDVADDRRHDADGEDGHDEADVATQQLYAPTPPPHSSLVLHPPPSPTHTHTHAHTQGRTYHELSGGQTTQPRELSSYKCRVTAVVSCLSGLCDYGIRNFPPRPKLLPVSAGPHQRLACATLRSYSRIPDRAKPGYFNCVVCHEVIVSGLTTLQMLHRRLHPGIDCSRKNRTVHKERCANTFTATCMNMWCARWHKRWERPASDHLSKCGVSELRK